MRQDELRRGNNTEMAVGGGRGGFEAERGGCARWLHAWWLYGGEQLWLLNVTKQTAAMLKGVYRSDFSNQQLADVVRRAAFSRHTAETLANQPIRKNVDRVQVAV